MPEPEITFWHCAKNLKSDVEIFGVTENEDLTVIASAKAAAIKSNVGFSSLIPPDRYDLVDHRC